LKIEGKKKFQGLRDEVPNVLRFLYEVEKRLSAPSNFWWKYRRTSLERTLTKLRTLDVIILLSFF